jgi:hypothetical protein
MSKETSSQGLLSQKPSQQYNNVRRQFCLCVVIENVVGDTMRIWQRLLLTLVSEVITRYEPFGYFVAMNLMLLI